MRFVGNGRPSSADGERYARRRATSDRAGPDRARLDVYRRRVSPHKGERADDAYERVRARLLGYDIFPTAAVAARVCPGPDVRKGAVIVQRFRVGAFAIESATRVIEVWDERDGQASRFGFAYVTLAGHPERGVATFEVWMADGKVEVEFTARSIPGTLATRLGRPVARPVQRGLTWAGIRRVAR